MSPISRQGTIVTYQHKPSRRSSTVVTLTNYITDFSFIKVYYLFCLKSLLIHRLFNYFNDSYKKVVFTMILVIQYARNIFYPPACYVASSRWPVMRKGRQFLLDNLVT